MTPIMFGAGAAATFTAALVWQVLVGHSPLWAMIDAAAAIFVTIVTLKLPI